ncbi:MAG TPA: GAF domain-containing sensor histidine kinase [Actinocrinis sp.]|uniref:GAF domain-containing sensor histidine kinase n=1 Tax=Actinocrinis sp. TaxID=1920516 RepID=UPI002DDCE195|nr:GAF domain-containing sensor histidine kinase [Actinocrinis sp.]HEV2344676.1 GAF domain-containing sensor histidine kinase [Actinocrinis sp.]
MAEQLGDGDEVSRILPTLRIDELLDELQLRLASVRSSRDRVRQLLDAVVGIGSGLDLEQALARIVQAAVTLVDARYGALGVLGPGGDRLARFITVGLTEEQIAAIGPFPQGHGLLGELIRHPVPLRTEDLTRHPRSFGFPANHPPMHSFLGVPVRVRDEVFGNLYITEKDGGAPFDADDEAVLTALAAAAGVAIDNARLYDEARRRQEWLETTSELTRGLLSGEDVDDVLAAFAQGVRRFTACDLAVIAVPDPDGGELLVAAADGRGADRVRGAALGVEGTLAGAVFKSARVEALVDVAADARAGALSRISGVDFGPVLLVPLGGAGQVRGVLALYRLAGASAFEQVTIGLTTDLAVQAAVVLELAERRRDSELLSLYADRDRIGRDLHDLAIQRLFATSMSLQGAYKIAQKPAVARRIMQAVSDLDDTIKVIRSTIFALHAHEDEGDAVPGARAQVIEICEQAARTLGFSPAVRFTGPVDHLVSADVAEHLAAVLREALSNIARHAGASSVEVDLAADGSSVALTVTDDGVGIKAGGRRSGLENLRERAQQLGGSFSVLPGPSGGTVLAWRVPTGLGIAAGGGLGNGALGNESAGNETIGAGTRVEGP